MNKIIKLLPCECNNKLPRLEKVRTAGNNIYFRYSCKNKACPNMTFAVRKEEFAVENWSSSVKNRLRIKNK